MFDVIWTDPNVELVGQRMLRKEQEAKEKEKKKRESGRQSVSTSSVSSSSDRGFSLFPSRAKRKPSTPLKGKASHAPGEEELGPDDEKAHRTSKLLLPAKHLEREGARSPSPRDSALSKWAQQAAIETGAFDMIEANSAVSEPKTETHVQTLGPSSFITQTIETATSPRIDADIDQLIIETHISSDGTKTQTPPLAEVPEDTHQVLPPPTYQNYDHLANPEAWKPPHEWDCTPTKQAATAMIDERLQISPAKQASNNSMFPAFAALQRERRMMAAASTELMLTNLKSGMGEASDASVYKELEMTKKRWMFSALHQQGGYAQLIEHSSEHSESPTQPKRNRILALYETHARVRLNGPEAQTMAIYKSPHQLGTSVPYYLAQRDISGLVGSWEPSGKRKYHRDYNFPCHFGDL
ncbi:hypothetical protein ONZ43_g2033 [Nemania bipapillata]|uniref:Uncharacterized protein n=1 Tax=Nemania bipapillata TaxID=110536 RepID=A0ACC2J263_9PEZI|nr:hypothetical protein ONZ43_g2033 [Nemania bipapillata]